MLLAIQTNEQQLKRLVFQFVNNYADYSAGTQKFLGKSSRSKKQLIRLSVLALFSSMFTLQPSLLTMFSSLGLFKQVECPEYPHCSLSNCIFAHQSSPTGKIAEKQQLNPELTKATPEDDVNHDGPRKKRRLSGDDYHSARVLSTPIGRSPIQPLTAYKSKIETDSPVLPLSASREISPPRQRRLKTLLHEYSHTPDPPAIQSPASAKPDPKDRFPRAVKSAEVSLNPRMMPNPPASHATRMQLITMMHEQMARLNEEIKQSEDPSVHALKSSPQELVVEALAKEESIAKSNPAVYLNVVKLRITKLKKMKLADWKEERLKQMVKRTPMGTLPNVELAPKVIETGLSSSQELAFLSRLLAKQDALVKYGYVPKAPSDEEVAKAREGTEAAQGWEQCDRCKTRFQVFPGRRAEDGALTSGGACSYHPMRPRRPLVKDKADKSHRELAYICCNEAIGETSGCTQATTHVFKVSDPKRLALTMPFQATPPKTMAPAPRNAVCFDCEMGYTTMGMELIRLTATAWPNGEQLIDVFVRPLGEMLDLNSRFSGVWPKDYANALPYGNSFADEKRSLEEGTESQSHLRIVDSPAIARDLLFDCLTPETPLLGHALDNDLNVTRILHPSIVDTVLLYPHPRGLPIRFGLKMLMKRHLDRDIQMGGARGHDSKEDARAAGDLVRLKISEEWKSMKRVGWTLKGTEFVPPSPSAPTSICKLNTSGTESKA